MGLTLLAFSSCAELGESTPPLSQSSGASSLEEASLDSSSEGAAKDENSTGSSAEEGKKEIYYTVQFDTDSGEKVDTMSVLSGEKVDTMSVLSGEKLAKPVTPNKITQDCEYVFCPKTKLVFNGIMTVGKIR